MWSPRFSLLIAAALGLAFAGPALVEIYAPAAWPLDVHQHAVGRDFLNLWAAGRLWLQGELASLFSAHTYIAALQRVFDPAVAPHFWSYPPTSLLLAAPFGLVPYGVALALWTLAGLAGFLAAARLGLARHESLAVAGLLVLAPATLANIVAGQNGFLTAALLAPGILLLDRRPVVAGVCLGLLSYKPHFGILIVPALLALGAWRAIAAAAASALALALASVLAFGLQPWRAFLAVTLRNQAVLLSDFDGFFTSMLVSPYALLRHLGLAHGAALTLQAAVTLTAIAVVVVLVRRARDADLRLALVAVGTFVASPYALTYDLPIVALVLARLALRDGGWRPAEAVLCGLAWALPIAAIPLALEGVPVAAVALVALFALVARRVLACSQLDAARRLPSAMPAAT
jgi:hypothetical protein